MPSSRCQSRSTAITESGPTHAVWRRWCDARPRGSDRRGDARAVRAWHPGDVNELESLITDWLPLPDIAERLDVEVSRVRRLIEEGQLIAVRRGQPVVRMVPALLIADGEIIPHLAGTITVLRDGGFADEEVLSWLFTEDETLPGRPIDQLRKGQRGEVRRRALALAL